MVDYPLPLRFPITGQVLHALHDSGDRAANGYGHWAAFPARHHKQAVLQAQLATQPPVAGHKPVLEQELDNAGAGARHDGVRQARAVHPDQHVSVGDDVHDDGLGGWVGGWVGWGKWEMGERITVWGMCTHFLYRFRLAK